jgi:glycosyltransferase involved in cell wall biosynthesis
MADRSLVSIIIPFYNSEKHIEDTIRSAMGQSWPNKEIILVDDGSIDQSLSIAKKYVSDQVKVYTQKNKGASAARNNGLNKAAGDYIQFLDADDLLGTNKIASQVKLLQSNPGKISVCSTVHFPDGKNHCDFKPSDYEEAFLIDSEPLWFLNNLWGGYTDNASMIQPNAWLVPKAIIDKGGPWNEELTLDDDGEFFCRVILASEGIVVARDTFNYYRKSPGKSLSTKKDLKSLQSAYASITLKQQHLRAFNSDLTNKIITRSLTSLLADTYPEHKQLSARIMSDIKELGGTGYTPALGGRTIEYIKGIIGWKAARKMQYYYAKLFRSH